MKINAVQITHAQGSEAWMQHRAKACNASDLAVVMGLSPYKTRAQYIAERATGITPNIDAATQKRFDRGHEYEAIARGWAEEILGTELYPVVLAAEVEGLLISASLDGLPVIEDPTWEHKSGNAALLASLEAGVIPDQYHPQLEQGLMLSGASRCMFMASSGDREAMRFAWYESNPELRAKIIPTWKQVHADIAAYVPLEVLDKPVAAPITALPAVSVQVTGEIAVRDNFALFEKALRDFIDNRLIREPSTDQEFADLDLQIKALKNAESALDAAEAQMLAQVSTVDTIKRTKDMLHKLARDNRLMAEKLLEARKLAIKGEIVAGGVAALAKHIRELNAAMPGDYMPVVPADFGGAVKGKRTVDSLRDAVNVELARAKIAANEIATRIGVNIKHLQDKASAHKFLFLDTPTIVLKAPDDLQALVANRINAHELAEQKKQDELREKIRKEEADRLQREADERAAEEKRIADAAEAQRLADEAQAKQKTDALIAAVATPAPAPAPAPEVKTYDNGAPVYSATTFKDNGEPIMLTPEGKRSVFCDIADDLTPEKPTLKLGEISQRLGFTVTADFLESLGFPAHTERSSKLYRPGMFPAICDALIQHITTVADEVTA